MPRLEGADGAMLDVEVVGYKFRPEEVDNDFDGNWVIVQIEASDGGPRLKARVPAFLSWELGELVEWLREIADGRGRRGFSGLEPHLQFEWEPDGDPPSLTAVFGGDFLVEAEAAELSVPFTPSAEEIRAFALGLEAEAAGVPVRVIQPDGYASRVVAGRSD